MAELDAVVDAVCDALRETGVPVVMAAYPFGAKERHARPAVTVGVAGGSGVSAGFAEYMGIEYDRTADTYSELYGKRMELTLSVTIWSPKTSPYGAAACHSLFGDIMEATPLMPSGLKVREVNCGEVRFDSLSDMFRLGAEIKVTAFFSARRTDDAEVLDFILRGTVR